jgi:nicotinamidase-related amidase
MNNSVLVIIDMQEGFLSALESDIKHTAIQNCAVLVERAINHDEPIIFLEWNDGVNIGGEGAFKATTPELLDLTKDYKNRYTIYKKQQDGSDKVQLVVKHHKLNAEIIKICGIFTDQCVLSTVFGLIDKFKTSKVLVYETAVATSSSYSHEYGVKEMSRAGAVIV